MSNLGSQISIGTTTPRVSKSKKRRPRGPCVYCKLRLSCRPRGLCWACYYTPEIRAQIPISNSKYAKRDEPYYRGEDPTPTNAKPGTPEKMKVLEYRANNGLGLFNSKDTLRLPDSLPFSRCANCGNEFIPLDKRVKYCSRECRSNTWLVGGE